jgi:hypothetical protein
VTDWIRSNAAVQPADVAWARYGLALRAATQPDIAEAVSSAGNIGYFSRRPAIDLLGKSDPVIAHSRPVYVAAHFLPGHSKWHYDYSIGKLRPPIVAQIFGPVPADALRAWGYERVGALWYLPQTTGIDVERLRAAAALAR